MEPPRGPARPTTSSRTRRYFVASVLILAALVALLAISTARRTQRELALQLEDKGAALADAVEVASRHAVRDSALLEDLTAQRLFDNARLVDQLLLERPADPAASLARVRELNGLRRVDLLDRDGQPYSLPGPPAGPRPMMRGPMMGGRMGSDDAPLPSHHERMRFFWGRRWGHPPDVAADAPARIRDRRFWEGTDFGVAVAARSFPGIIAVHADARSVLDFRRRTGVERQLEELGRQAGVESVALLGPGLEVLAHSEPGRVGARLDDAHLTGALRERRATSRLVVRPDGRAVLEVARPVELGGAGLGLVRVDLSTEPMQRAWARDVRAAALLGSAVLLLGGLGLGAVFLVQHRHLRDVRALEQEVDRRERLAALGNLAATVAHEIRNPLNAVSVGLQRLREEFPPAGDAPEHARIVELAQGEVRRLNGIVEEFLSLARPLPLHPGPVAPGELLDGVAALVRDELRPRGIRLDVHAAPGLPLVRLDRDRLVQVLLNLVRNAGEAMSRGGVLTLAAAAHGATLQVTVEDTGEGIPPALLPRVFEPYVTTKTQGLGLGLAIARRIVEDHGGRIAAASRPGGGARLTITLPLGGPPPAATPPADG